MIRTTMIFNGIVVHLPTREIQLHTPKRSFIPLSFQYEDFINKLCETEKKLIS